MRNSRVVLLFLLLAGWVPGRPTAAEAISPGFIENRGQVNEAVRYYLPGAGAAVYFTPGAVVLDLKERARAGRARPASRTPADRGCAVYIRFKGGDPSPAIEARRPLATQYNFFLGNDPAKWRSEVPAYAEVVYRDVWPGTDLVFRVDRGALSYEVSAHGGVRTEAVAFDYEGPERVRSEGAGIERVETPVGPLIHRQAGLAGEFRRQDAEERPMDNPTALIWSTFLGGSDHDWAYAMTLDSPGNPVVTGETWSSNFPTTPGAYEVSYNGYDVFVAKFSSSGQELLWSTFLGGTGSDAGYALTLAPSGDPVVTGYTQSSDFPTTAGAYDRSFNGNADAFVARLSSSGSVLLWSTFLGGTDDEWSQAVALAPSGDPVVTGGTYSSDFPTTAGVYDRSYNGYADIFVAKLSSSGSDLLWSTYLGGADDDWSQAIAMAPSGDPVLTGYTRSSSFPATSGAYDTAWNGGWDTFVARLSSSGKDLQWSTFLGGGSDDLGYALALAPSADPVVTGYTRSSDFPVTAGAYDTAWNGDWDVFVARLSSSGHDLEWSTFLGGGSADLGYAVALSPSADPVVAGVTYSSGFPTTAGGYDGSFNGQNDVFVAKLSSSGNQLLWSSFLGGTDSDGGYALAVAPSGDPVVAGFTASSDFPTTSGAYDGTFNGLDDAFVAKLHDPATSTHVAAAPDGSWRSFPNPTAGVTTLRLALDKPGPVAVCIFDGTGRLIRALHELTWDGRDEAGAQVRPGIYFYRASAGGETRTGKLVVAR